AKSVSCNRARARGNRMHFDRLKRREFITLLGGAATAWPLATRAQPSAKGPRIGMLSPGRLDPNAAPIASFEEGLPQLGYTEGQTIAIERRFAEWSPDRLRDAANDLVARKVDVIVARSTQGGRAAKQATSTIPIVVTAMADPVGDELVASLARPGG